MKLHSATKFRGHYDPEGLINFSNVFLVAESEFLGEISKKTVFRLIRGFSRGKCTFLRFFKY